MTEINYTKFQLPKVTLSHLFGDHQIEKFTNRVTLTFLKN